MEELDAVLRIFYVDYLGRYERRPRGLETPHDAMKKLVERGVTDKKFLPNGELSTKNGYLVLRDNIKNVSYTRFGALLSRLILCSVI